MKFKSPLRFAAMLVVTTALTVSAGECVELRPQLVKTNGGYSVELWSGSERVGLAPGHAPAGIQLRLPGSEFQPVRFARKHERRGDLKDRKSVV